MLSNTSQVLRLASNVARIGVQRNLATSYVAANKAATDPVQGTYMSEQFCKLIGFCMVDSGNFFFHVCFLLMIKWIEIWEIFCHSYLKAQLMLHIDCLIHLASDK